MRTLSNSGWTVLLPALAMAGAGWIASTWYRQAQHRVPAGTPVLLITVDTLRPDGLGWVAGKNATPNIDALAETGVAFSNAVAPAPLTLPSHASIMSGRNPAHHGVRDNGQNLPEGVALLADRLHEKGYGTAAFVSAFVLLKRFGLDHGFDHYDDQLTSGKEGWLDRPAAATVDAAISWIRQNPDKPWFVWLHLYDPHTPYAPPKGFEGNDEYAQYLGEIRYVDQEIGRLLGQLKQLRQDPLVVLSGDHGEAFGEHGEVEHGLFVYDTTTLVPLIFSSSHLPPSRPTTQPRLIDIAPTILDLLGLPPFDKADGISLADTLFGEPQEIPDGYSETFVPWTTYGWSPLAALRSKGWKVIDGPAPELYHLTSDPDETRDLVNQDVVRSDRMQLAVDALKAPRDALDSTRIQDEETMRELASLGYLGNASVQDIPTSGLANPRDRLKERNILRHAESLMHADRHEAALDAFEQVLQTDPNNRYATLRSGITLLKMNRFDDAIPRLRKSVEIDPSQVETHYALADALTRSGQIEAAIQQWMETVRLQPRRAAAWGNLALTLRASGRNDEAMNALVKALEIAPDDVRLLQNMALQQRQRGDRKAAIGTLEKAASVGGDEFVYPALLGLMLYDEKLPEDAEKWLLRVKPADANYAEARFRLAQIMIARGDREPARASLSEAIRARPSLLNQAHSLPELEALLAPDLRPIPAQEH
ncbi:MAG TPA: sulfatase-like hydrolase/transferase [Dokdonella sp.]|uniref:sulfatase-like hydrolase/transferase n=3 Tax=Dokdonella sp. TaxID=2291710 RepID=UPI002C03D2F2|nr:sulfatase-like hydrolase/transferase [Dokdonella sp.]HOX71590.1 sulfatase-like hydrolase/transferase [Dokdonella sp.]